jgi:carboxyl-terminal processing protease
VKVQIFREAAGESFEVPITRDIVKIIPVRAKLVQHDVGLIKIMTFNASTADSVFKEYFKLVNQAKENNRQLKGVILDLRWNPGGLFEQAIQVSSLFLNEKSIVSIKGKMLEMNHLYNSNGSDMTEGMPIVVLINGGSASASEIVAGALQDHDRALVMGTKSFGKGSVQTLFPMAGNTAIKLTTALYYTPSGRSIHLKGIEPDVVVDEAVVTPIKNHEPGSSETQANPSLAQDLRVTSKSKVPNVSVSMLEGKEQEDYQLLRAIDAVKGMALYNRKSHE